MNILSRLKQKFKKKQPIEYIDFDQFVKENIVAFSTVGSSCKLRNQISEAFLDFNGPDEKELRIIHIQYSFIDKLSKII